MISIQLYLDKKGNISNLLEFEAKQARQKANQVMERIMKTSGVEKKVIRDLYSINIILD